MLVNYETKMDFSINVHVFIYLTFQEVLVTLLCFQTPVSKYLSSVTTWLFILSASDSPTRQLDDESVSVHKSEKHKKKKKKKDKKKQPVKKGKVRIDCTFIF